MTRAIGVSGLALMLLGTAARADVFALSPDGSAVVRVNPGASISAAGFDTALLPAGYTATTGSTGSLTVTSYDAKFRSGNGGAQFTALYDTGLQASSNLNWIQVINTNDPLGGATPPYLDNAFHPTEPFYSFTQENRNTSLPENQLNFYDFSTRPPADLATINPITWSAALYPVIVGANGTSLEVENGTSWGWSMKKATVGTDSAVFVDPIPDPDAVLTGVNTNSFAWGSGNPSSLTFDGRAFDTLPNTTFDLGTLTFHNGTISSGTGANGVWFDLAIAFDNVPEKNFHLKTQFGIVNTLNTDDPIASADFVTIGDFGYTFNVLEGGTASVDIFAKLTTGLSGVPAGTAGDSLISSDPFDPSPNYTLTIVGLGNPTAGGFVTTPEPTGLVLLGSALGALLCLCRKRGALRR